MSDEEKPVDKALDKDQVTPDKEENSVPSNTEGEITPKDEGEQPQEKVDVPVEVAEAIEEDESIGLDESQINEDLDVSVDPAIVEKLSSGFLQKFLPTLEKSKSSLDEVLSNQKILIETVEQENAKFRECQAMEELTQTMLKAKKYYNKLMNIKKDMGNLHEKSGKLKKRAVKLQQQKQKEELQKAQQREKEHEKERMLAARVAKHTDS